MHYDVIVIGTGGVGSAAPLSSGTLGLRGQLGSIAFPPDTAKEAPTAKRASFARRTTNISTTSHSCCAPMNYGTNWNRRFSRSSSTRSASSSEVRRMAK